MLNTKQQEFADAVMNSSEKIFTLLGSSGTGKSHTVAQVVNALPGTTILTATTHAAKDQLSRMSGYTAATIQSILGFRLEKRGYNQVLLQNPKKKIKPADILVVDEISMLPLPVYKAVIASVNHGTFGKVIFLGDPLQLPSPDKTVDVTSIPGHLTILTEQMRQDSSDTALNDYFMHLRASIEDGLPIEAIPALPAVTTYTDHKAFCNAYHTTDAEKLLIGYRNNCVDKYNSNLTEGDTHFSVGDRVIIDKPIQRGKETYAQNGEVVVITGIEEFDETINLTVNTLSQNTAVIIFWKSSSALASALDKLQDQGDKVAYWYVKDNSYRPKHEFACTVYKSQGRSVNTVFLDLTDLFSAHSQNKTKWNNPISLDLFHRMMFVALGRMESHAHVFIGQLRDYTNMRR